MVSFRVRKKDTARNYERFFGLGDRCPAHLREAYAYSNNQLILRNTGDKIPLWFGVLLEPDLRFVAL